MAGLNTTDTEKTGGFESFEDFERKLEIAKQKWDEIQETVNENMTKYIDKTLLLKLLKMDDSIVEVTEEEDPDGTKVPGCPQPMRKLYNIPYESLFPEYYFSRCPVDPKHIAELAKNYNLFQRDEGADFTVLDNEYKVMKPNSYMMEKYKYELEIWQYCFEGL